MFCVATGISTIRYYRKYNSMLNRRLAGIVYESLALARGTDCTRPTLVLRTNLQIKVSINRTLRKVHLGVPVNVNRTHLIILRHAAAGVVRWRRTGSRQGICPLRSLARTLTCCAP